MTGIGYRDAQVGIARAGLRIGRLVHTYSETVPKDGVVSTDPEPGSRVEPGGRIDLLVSLGPQVTTFLLPDLRGRPIGEVREFFGRAGIRVVERPREAFGAPPGQVLEQTPPAGSRIRNGEMVEVAVASAGRGD
jgi:serine/threonine-protein kinase